MRTDRVALLLVAGLFAALLVVLAATGAWLTFNYRPGLDPLARWVHLVAAVLAVPVGLAVPAVALARSRPHLGLCLVFALAVGVSFLTGLMLPWDTLALDVVRPGADFKGVLAPFRSEVEAVLLDDVEVGLGAYRLRVVEHLVVLPAVLLAAGGFLLRR